MSDDIFAFSDFEGQKGKKKRDKKRKRERDNYTARGVWLVSSQSLLARVLSADFSASKQSRIVIKITKELAEIGLICLINGALRQLTRGERSRRV